MMNPLHQSICRARYLAGSSTLAILAIALVALTGCARKAQDYVPSQSVAEDAIRATLQAWKETDTIGELPNTKPSIYVTDNKRKRDQKLSDFTILGEVSGTAGRTYMVELALINPKEKIKAQYIVVGIDPLWVFRQEDYELLMHWDHHMPEINELKTTSPETP
ncbi:MAG: hypothetical protein U0930_21440 [Pirellulales bacterium]